MNTKSIILLLAVALAQPSSLSAATNDLTSSLQKGLFEEEANHDLDAAIRAYQAIATQFDKDRKLAATAIFRLGECYRKQGNTNDANTQYQRVLREFADQSALATLSRQNLALLGGSPPSATTASLPSAAVQEQKRLLLEEIKLAEQTLAEQQKQVEAGIANQESVRSTQRDILRLKRQLAALDVAPTLETLEVPVQATTTDEAEEVKRIQAMIKDSPDLINAVDEHSRRTPLHDAADKGQLIVAQFLLANGADPAAKDGNGDTPLHLAAAGGHRAMAELLLSKKAPLSAFDNRGNTPLHAAAEKGFKSVVELFLAKGADVNARTSTGPTPLHLAVANGFRAVAEVLLARGADPNIIVPAIYSSGVNYQGGAPLHIAAQRGDAALAELLLANKAQVNAFNGEGLTPLHVAAEKGSVEVAKLLLSHGAEVDAKALAGEPYRGWPPLAVAVSRNQKDIVALLLEKGADPNLQFDVTRNPDNPGSKLSPPEQGDTALLLAMRKGNLDIANLLLSHRAKPNLKNDAGMAPLFWATWSTGSPDHENLIQTLLEHGADPNATFPPNIAIESTTPLMSAAQATDKPAAELLLAHKAEVNAQNKRGWTAMHFLADRKSGNIELAKLLLKAGADVNLQNGEGKTPLNYLPLKPPQTDYQAKMVALLREHGALEDLPRPDRIEIRRPASGYSSAIFFKGTNGWNHFTLYELLGVQYGLLTGYPQGEKRNWSQGTPNITVPYPDLSHLRLRRPGKDLKSWQQSIVNLNTGIQSGDCSNNPSLDWGDVIEIPELDHPLNETWSGFSRGGLEAIKKCLSREIEIVIKGKPNKISLAPQIDANMGPTPGALMLAPPRGVMNGEPFWIKPVLMNSKLLLASSDLSQVKVTRTDPGTGEKHDWVVDCSESSPAPDLWLRDGDVIEVPEKP